MPTPKFARLPAPIRVVTIPRYFSPSRWEAMEQCRLSVWGRDRAVLPETPESIVGRLLHEAREGILREGAIGLKNSARARAIILEVKQSYETKLGSDADYMALIPLEHTYGRRKWIDRVQTMVRWAANEELVTIPHGPETSNLWKEAETAEPTRVQPDAFSIGLEQPWVCNDLRLRGKPDQARQNSRRMVEVLDFKSGAVFDSHGELSAGIETQLRLYMLMAGKLTGHKAKATVSTNSGSYDVRWTEEDRKRLLERVLQFGSENPVGAEVEASTIANPGSHCIGCRLRPSCAKYLSEMPSKWTGKEKSIRLPYDTWGTVMESYQDDIGWCLRIRDAAERTVAISGLAPIHGVEDIEMGNTVFVFNAQPSEETFRHGRKLIPLSFHEQAPGLNKNSAKQLRLFVGQVEK